MSFAASQQPPNPSHRPPRVVGTALLFLGLALPLRTARADDPPPAAPAVAPAAASAPTEAAAPTPHLLSFSVAFGHWMGFGRPDGYTTPAASLGVLPGVAFLELRGRYSFSTEAVTLANGSESWVGFASLEVLLRRELRLGREILTVFAGPLGIVAHAASVTPGYGFGMTLGFEYLFATGASAVPAVGMTVSTRGLALMPPGEHGEFNPLTLRRDVQVDLGAVARFF